MILILLSFIAYISSTSKGHICKLCDIYDLTYEKKFEETIKRRIDDLLKDIQFYFTEKKDYIYVMALEDRIIINNNGQYEEIQFSKFPAKTPPKISNFSGYVDIFKKWLWQSIQKKISKNCTVYLDLEHLSISIFGCNQTYTSIIEFFFIDKLKNKENVKFKMMNQRKRNHTYFEDQDDTIVSFYNNETRKTLFINSKEISKRLLINYKDFQDEKQRILNTKNIVMHLLLSKKNLLKTQKTLYEIFCFLIENPVFKNEILNYIGQLEETKVINKEFDVDRSFYSDILSIINMPRRDSLENLGEKINCMVFAFDTILGCEKLKNLMLQEIDNLIEKNQMFVKLISNFYTSFIDCVAVKIHIIARLYKLEMSKECFNFNDELNMIIKTIPYEYQLFLIN